MKMKKAYRDYIYKGWNIRSSQYYNNWEVQPIFEGTEEEINNLYENFVNNEYITFNTLKECKQWILTSDAEEIKNKYTRG